MEHPKLTHPNAAARTGGSFNSTLLSMLLRRKYISPQKSLSIITTLFQVETNKQNFL
jgi:hypothetical protein